MNVSDLDRRILTLAGQWFRYEGHREGVMLAEFDMSPTAFWRRVNALIDDPAALAEYPVLVNRLRRLRASRLTARSLRRVG